MTPAPHEPDVALALAGDSAAFERLYGRHSATVYSLAVRMFDAAEAEALTQDVFVRAWQKLATFRGDASFATWLRRLALNLFASRHRSLAAERGHRADDAAPAFAEDQPGLRLDLERAIGRLPSRARAVFVLHDVGGHSHDEIAALLDVSVGTSKSQLHRARQLLCAALREDK
jgi:RNA polymerase sigma-70 factor (ECF subfamily)